jgi:hypothetical protein
MKDYFRRAPHRQEAIIEKAYQEKQPYPALSSVAGTTSDIRSQRIQGGLISTTPVPPRRLPLRVRKRSPNFSRNSLMNSLSGLGIVHNVMVGTIEWTLR